jgi:hypothetical protein
VTTGAQLDPGAPLDPRQLARIEHVHRGFLYQHVYAARALLGLRGADAVLVVEHDEDVEVLWPDRHAYVQVKFRTDGLSRPETTRLLARFDALRAQHASGARSGAPTFVVATNTRPRLAPSEIAALPADVHLCYPGAPDVEGLPVPAASAYGGFAELEADAATVPLAGLSPESLAMKLVGVMNALASGVRNHRIPSSDIGLLCDLIVEQLQSFPVPPSPYRRQRGEPELLNGARIRILNGLSGAGKTAWASTKALVAAEPIVYFDVAGIPEANLPLSLARELTARFIDDPRQRPALIAGEVAGMDVLRAVARRIATPQALPILVLDNVHLLDPSATASVTRALDPVRVVMLSQPSPALRVLAASLQIEIETLAGWDDDTIAREIVARGAHADIVAITRLRRLTSALPLFVATAARLATVSYDGDVAQMCSAIERGISVQRTAQDELLERFVQTLAPATLETMALFGLAEVSLTRDEALALGRSRAGDDAAAAAHLRALTSADILQAVSGGKLTLHDAFRPLALTALAELGPEASASGRIVLREILGQGLAGSGDVERLRLWMRLAAETGDIDTLTDLALDEMIHQIGGPEIVRSTLESAVDSERLGPSKQFDALDALAFWDAQRGDGSKLVSYVARMVAIADGEELEPRQLANLAGKQISIALAARDRQGLEAAYQRGLAAARGHVGCRRMLSHNRSRALLRMGRLAEAGAAAEALVTEYLDGFGLRLDDLPMTQQHTLLARIPDYPDRSADMQHLADALHVLALTKRPPARTMLMIQALKFYSMAWMPYSVVRVGQDVADDFLSIGDPVGARIQMEEYVLPVIDDHRLADLMLDVRAQYAVVLAHAGEIGQARSLMRTLEAYDADPTMRAQLCTQREMIEAIGRTVLQGTGGQLRRPGAKVGRNDPCPCGSGTKFKKCHGRALN